MATVEISAVTHPAHGEADDPVISAHLDYPRTGPVDGYAFEVNGWVVGSAPVHAVEFGHGERVLARCVPSVDRPDVADKFQAAKGTDAGPPGFWKAIGTVGLPPEFRLWVRAVFTDGRSGRIAEITGRQFLAPAISPTLRPLILSGLGRSGTTWLMRMLAEHPEVLVHERHPYETRICGYWMHFLKVLATPVDLSAPPKPFDFYRDPVDLAQFPYYLANPVRHAAPPAQAAIDRWYGGEQVHRLAEFAQRSVESCYREYAVARGRPDAVFFAEKSAPADHLAWLVWQLYPTSREIFLVRDPRDIVTSMLAFNRRRGFAAFGREAVTTDAEFVDVVASDMRRLAGNWRCRRDRGVLVRYPDLVADPHEALTAMLTGLGLDRSPSVVDAMVRAGATTTALMARHRTTSDGPASVGRWSTDLPPALRARCEVAMAGLLDGFG